MDFPELSLAPAQYKVGKTDNHRPEINLPIKRKSTTTEQITDQTSVELQLNDALPLDWEQCLDLESGKMYYINRKTLRKSWNWPKEQKLDLELNISSYYYGSNIQKEVNNKQQISPSSSNSSTNMMALACSNCHLLVILSRASPSCPNCKHVNSLPQEQPTMALPKSPRPAVKSSAGLSL